MSNLNTLKYCNNKCLIHRARFQEPPVRDGQAYFIDPRYPGVATPNGAPFPTLHGFGIGGDSSIENSNEQLFTLHPCTPVPFIPGSAPAPTPHTELPPAPVVMPDGGGAMMANGDKNGDGYMDAMGSASGKQVTESSSVTFDEGRMAADTSGPLMDIQIMGKRIQNVN